MIDNNKYIKRCFDIARYGIGTTSPNPSVGAVIVDMDDRIIGEGWTSPYGGAHAEVNAIASVKPENQSLLQSSTLYVSLEPCFHFGKTPPCVDLILHHKIPHVVIAYTDPNPKVAGKSIEKLRQQGVKVDILSSTNSGGKHEILSPFFTNISTKRPYIILKWAETVDGFMGFAHETVPISNLYAKRLVHKWRSEADAIMVATNTAAVDNPELTNRLYYGQSPIRVVLDKKRRLKADLHVFDNSVKTLIYTEGGILPEKINNIDGWQYRYVHFDENAIQHILQDLYSQNIGILFVEGGAKLLHSLIEKKLWDEARVFKTSTIIERQEGIAAPKISSTYLEKSFQLFDNQLLIFRNA